MPREPFLTASQAAAELGISVATLYAYVSRGMLRSEPVAGGGRGRRYPREDVERLQRRQAARRDPAAAASGALDWGVPLIESAITAVEDGRLYYRGHDAVELASRGGFEAVASLLWGAGAAEGEAAAAAAPPPAAAPPADDAGLGPLERCQVALPRAGAADPAAWNLRPEAVAAAGRRILRVMAAALSGRPADPAGMAASLAGGWGLRDAAARRALDAALILCADHELNVSAFTARCVASAGGNPYDAVAAAVAALKGNRHGGVSARVESLLAEVEGRGGERAVRERLRRGEPVPGFGHRLYPAGDPRARALLEIARGVGRGASALGPIDELVEAAARLLGERPALDVALVALARALELPPGAPLTLFAAGRAAGWVAQVIEEVSRGRLIRPRARYVGVAVGGGAGAG